MTICDEIIDELLSGQDPQAVFSKDGLQLSNADQVKSLKHRADLPMRRLLCQAEQKSTRFASHHAINASGVKRDGAL